MKNDEKKKTQPIILQRPDKACLWSLRASEPVQRVSGRKSENSDQNRA